MTQNQKYSQLQKAYESVQIKMSKCIIKLLVVMSIAIPLIIVMVTFLSDERQLLGKLMQWKDYQLIQKVNQAIFHLKQQIYENTIQNHLKDYIEIKNYSSKLQQTKNPIEVYDKLVFSIVLFNINPKDPPIKKERLIQIQSLVMHHFLSSSYIKNIMQKPSINIDRSHELNIEMNQQQINQIIKISIQSSHISQIEHNFQNKIIQLYQEKNHENKQRQSKKRNDIKASQYYIESILKQLRDTNKPKHCHYLISNTPCKEHTIYVLYGSNLDLDEIVNGYEDATSTIEKMNEFEEQEVDIDNNYYWTTEDHRDTLIVMPTDQSLSFLKSSYFFNFLTTIQQLLYDSLNMSQTLLLINKINRQFPQINQKNFHQIAINKFIHLNKAHKQLHVLNHILQIVDNTQIPYTRINDQIRQQLMNDLLTLESKENASTNSSKPSIPINYTTISMLTRIDTFPTEYKLGALAPIAIILIYPLFSLISYLRK